VWSLARTISNVKVKRQGHQGQKIGKLMHHPHCKVMGYSMVTCAKTAQPIDMPFCMNTAVGPGNHALHGGADLQKGRGSFWGFPPIENA